MIYTLHASVGGRNWRVTSIQNTGEKEKVPKGIFTLYQYRGLFIDSFSSWQKHQQKCKPFSSNTLLRPPHETLSSTCYGRTLQFHKVKQLNRFDLNCKWDAHCDASYSQRKRVHLKWEPSAISHILPINQKRGSQWNHDPEIFKESGVVFFVFFMCWLYW